MQQSGMLKLGVIVAILYWPAEAFVHAVLFSEGGFVENLISPDAHELWMRLFISCVFVCFGWYGQNVLNRLYLLQDRLNKKRTRLQEVIDRCYDAYVCMDCEGKITDWNRSAENMFGWPRQHMIGKLMEEIMPESLRDGHRKGMQLYLEQNIGHWLYKPVRTTALRRDGSEFAIEMVVTPINTTGDIEFFAFIRESRSESAASR